MTAKDYLLQYKRAKKRIKSIENTMMELETAIMSTASALDGMPRGTDLSDKTGRLASAMADKQVELYWAQVDAFHIMCQVSDAIGRMQDEEHMWLLTMRYINGFTWERIAVEMDRTYQWVAGPLHSYALQDFEKVMENLIPLDSN